MEFPHNIIKSIDGVKVKCVGLHWFSNGTWIPKYETVKNVWRYKMWRLWSVKLDTWNNITS